MDKKLALPDFLKLLTSNDIPVARAMAVASKIFKDYSTPTLLTQLDHSKLLALGVKDRDLRRLVLAAVRNSGHARSARKLKTEHNAAAQPVLASGSGSSTMQTLITPKKKRKYDEIELLPSGAPPDEGSEYGNMDFNDVLDEEALRAKSTVINRAPLLTAWAMVVAERLGFEREEALSIGSVYTEMNAVAKGVSLGIVDQTRKKGMEPMSGEQPYVDLMGRRPLYRTQHSKWRALVNGSPALPSAAFSYVSRAFRQTTPYVIGALRLLAESWSPQELNEAGFSLYADFRPTVDGWGKRGEVRCERILSLRKGEKESTKTQPSNSQHNQEPTAERRSESSPKKTRVLSPDDSALDDNFGLDEGKLGSSPESCWF